MEQLFRASAIAVSCTMLALVIKRGSVEMALVLTLAAMGVCAAMVVNMVQPVVERMREIAKSVELSPAILSPVLKCVGIGVVTRLSSDVCRDGGQTALAGAVELAGAAGAVLAALPLISTLLEMMESVM